MNTLIRCRNMSPKGFPTGPACKDNDVKKYTQKLHFTGQDTVTISNSKLNSTSIFLPFLGKKQDIKVLESKIRRHFSSQEPGDMSQVETIIPQIRKWLKLKLSSERYKHSISTEKAARKIAKKLKIDEKKPALAALLHDNAKELSVDKQRKICAKASIDISNFEEDDHRFHGYAGAAIAQKKLGITDNEVLNAIKHHNVKQNNSSETETVVYLADRIEPKLRSKSIYNKIVDLLDILPGIKKVN